MSENLFDGTAAVSTADWLVIKRAVLDSASSGTVLAPHQVHALALLISRINLAHEAAGARRAEGAR